MVTCSSHYGYPGTDAMLSMITDIWLPQIHRDVIDQARLGEECFHLGESLNCILKQDRTGKLPEANEQNEEVALDFAGPFQNEKKGIKFLLLSIDHISG